MAAMTDDVDIESLLQRMTLEEKVGQLSLFEDTARQSAFEMNPYYFCWDGDAIRDLIRRGMVGALFNGYGSAEGRETQRIAVEESRLGIPLLFGADVIHGMRTIFPIPLGEAASFEPDLATRTARAAAIEATAEGLHWTFAPVVDVVRDQRWGRVAEGAGEDVMLTSLFAAARVRGFQGDDLRMDDTLLATPKHFAAYGAVLCGLDYNSVDMSPQTLREVHLPPFKAAIEAGAMTIMTAYHDLNGIPATAHRELLTDILRQQWKFEGFVVSDYTSDFELLAHGYAQDERDACRLSFDAGTDVSMQSGVYMRHLASLVSDGTIAGEKLDDAVRRVLRVKAMLGLFDNPYRSLAAGHAERPRFAEHDVLARDAARRSIVMLKNDDQLLPLRKHGQHMALIGPFANDRNDLAGCWSYFGDAARNVDLETGLRAAMVDPGVLSVVKGCTADAPIPGGIDVAVKAARKADVVLLAIGEPSNYSGESQSRTQIILPAAQQALVDAVIATGTPVVVLLRNGRALALSGALLQARSILVTWFLGCQTGHAVADVIFGDYNPYGRLPVSFPRDPGQQPYYYNHTLTGRPYTPGGPEAYRTRWRETAHEALYPFGHGMGYSPFHYSATTLDTASMAWDGVVIVSADITNAGDHTGEEVVQLYIHDRAASRVRPIRELKGFQKILLTPGESQRVAFELSRHDFAFCGVDNLPVIEPGWFDVWISPSSTTGEKASFRLLEPLTAS
jgi:beta-glucosidase